MSVTITVSNTNINQNIPNFRSTPPTWEIKENTAVGTAITTLSATSPIGRTVRYFIAGGNVGHSFEMNPVSGELKTSDVIDYEMTE